MLNIRFPFIVMALALLSPLSGYAFADPIVLQVEDFKGTWRHQTNITGFTGKGFSTSNAKDPNVSHTTMDGSADIKIAGVYTVWTRAYSSENSDRSFKLQVTDTIFPTTHTQKLGKWTWEQCGEITLPVGVAPIKVIDVGEGFESVDAVYLSMDLASNPNTAIPSLSHWLVYPDGLPDIANPLRYNIDATRAAAQNRSDPATAKEWKTRAPIIKANLLKALGLSPMPEKTPLNAVITGRADRDFYTIENLLFESRPGFYVTANVYTPKDLTQPAPAIVVVPGHAMDDGKNYPLYQMGELGFVKEGFVVLAYDPIGQGERKLPGFAHDLGYGSLLVGQTNEGYIAWDTIRAFDYLTTRDDVDTDRLGLAGNSGGGENTFYTMPLDDRIKAGASFCFVCSYDLWLKDGGNHCICNHMPGLVNDMEQFEIIALNAPRAFMFGNAAEDKIFPVAGTRDTLRRSQAIFEKVSSPGRVRSVETDGGHGWSQPLREAGYGWMNHWLQQKGDSSPVPEVGIQSEDVKSQDILVFKGKPMPENAETVVSLNRARADKQIAQYDSAPTAARHWKKQARQWRDDLWDVLGGKPESFKPTARTIRTFEREGLHVEVLSIAVESTMEVGAIFAQPLNTSGKQPITIFVGGFDDKRLALLSGVAAEAVRQGPVLILEPRGVGESQQHENHLVSDSILLGRPLFAQQLWDLLQAKRYLETRGDVNKKVISLHGTENGGLLALYAAALDASFAQVDLTRTLASYRFYIEDSQPQSKSLSVPNILKVADIPHIAALAAPTPLTVHELIGYEKKALTKDEAAQTWAFPTATYTVVQASDSLEWK